jgi:hypothetical protein
MADKNISQLTALTGEGINRTNDQVAVWDADATTTKKVAAQDFVTTGLQDPTGATTTRVNKIVALDQTAYGAIGTPDSETLYVITDGKTKDSYTGQIDTLGNAATYVLDYLPVTARTVLSFKGEYTGTASGINVTLNVGVTTVGTLDLTNSGAAGFTVTIAGAPVDSTDKITLVTSGDASAVTNFAFVVEYQS